jgi:gliding motility-associated-like protein
LLSNIAIPAGALLMNNCSFEFAEVNSSALASKAFSNILSRVRSFDVNLKGINSNLDFISKFSEYKYCFRFYESITNKPSFTVDLGADRAICTGQSITLNGGLASSYLWSNGSTASSIIVSNPGSFWLQLDNGRCSGADTLSVYFADCEMEIQMPNVFTPNFDGLNDNFIPTQYRGISKATIRIFNRWGEEVFFSEDLMTGWNGTYKDNTCSDGTYFWIVKYNTNMNESKELKGFLMLTK